MQVVVSKNCTGLEVVAVDLIANAVGAGTRLLIHGVVAAPRQRVASQPIVALGSKGLDGIAYLGGAAGVYVPEVTQISTPTNANVAAAELPSGAGEHESG